MTDVEKQSKLNVGQIAIKTFVLQTYSRLGQPTNVLPGAGALTNQSDRIDRYIMSHAVLHCPLYSTSDQIV